MKGSRSDVFIPSTPALPLLAQTLLYARIMLPPSSILSRVAVSNFVLLVPMYPLGCGHSTARLLRRSAPRPTMQTASRHTSCHTFSSPVPIWFLLFSHLTGSALPQYSLSTMASADFPPFVVTAASAVGGTSSGKNTDFHSITAVFTSVASVWLLDFTLFGTLVRHRGLRRFLFVGPEICYRFFQLSDCSDHLAFR